MTAVHKIFLIPLKHRHKSSISFIKPDFNVALREISGITTDFRFFCYYGTNMMNGWVFLSGQMYCRNYDLFRADFLTVWLHRDVLRM